MKWVDGSEKDLTQLSAEDICGKLAVEMYDAEREQWLECDECLQNAMYIIDFDSEVNMEGFDTPYIGNFTTEYYAKIVDAFRAIGDDKDAYVIEKALQLDSDYTKLLDSTDNDEESDRIYEEFCDKIDELEQELYLNTEFDMWALLYRYVEEHIAKQ